MRQGFSPSLDLPPSPLAALSSHGKPRWVELLLLWILHAPGLSSSPLLSDDGSFSCLIAASALTAAEEAITDPAITESCVRFPGAADDSHHTNLPHASACEAITRVLTRTQVTRDQTHAFVASAPI